MADYAIQYDGVQLQSACPKAQVVDIVVQPIPIERTSKARATGNGSLLVRSRLLPRTVAISVEFPLDPSIGAYAANARRLRNWAERETECGLILPDYDGKCLNCVLTNESQYSIGQWYKPVTLTFTAFNDPCFISLEETVASVGSAFTVSGDEPALVTIEHKITQTLTNPVWTLETGYIIALTGTYSSGTIIIDCEKGYVSRDGNSLMTSLLASSRFYRFPRGVHMITGPSGGKIRWKERWHD